MIGFMKFNLYKKLLGSVSQQVLHLALTDFIPNAKFKRKRQKQINITKLWQVYNQGATYLKL